MIRLFAVQTFITTLLLTPTPLREPLLRNFALLPSATLAQSKIWNVFTAPYLESQPIRGLINTILLLLLSQRSFAPWTARQLLACVTIVNIIAACSTCISMLAAYVATRTSALMYVFTNKSANRAKSPLLTCFSPQFHSYRNYKRRMRHPSNCIQTVIP